MIAWTTLGDGIAALRREERPVPTPGPGQVLVRLRAATLNFRDLLVVNGVEHWKPAVPRVPVSDGVGVVEAVGDGVSRWRAGDRVAGLFLPHWQGGELTPEKGAAPLGGPSADGVMADYRLFDQQAVVGVPEHLADVEAAALPVAALTAWHAVRRRSDVRAGDTVLVQGTGGVSLFATQFVRALGALPIVLSSSDEKLCRVAALGATATVNYRTTPDWERAVLALTNGRGVDHVIEVVGGENLNRSLQAVRVSGTISFIGLIAGLRAPIDTYQFVMRNVRLHGIETGSREMFEEMNAFLAAHRLRPVLDRTFAAAELPAALRWLEGGGHFGKVGITF
jgi:NADPH:quinone reductase-like Zn-dependent oxidoreductase